MTLWALSEHWHCVESYARRSTRKGLKYPCPSRSWRLVEAIVWCVYLLYFLSRYMRPEGPWQRQAAALSGSSSFLVPIHDHVPSPTTLSYTGATPAIVWPMLMSFVWFQLGPQSLCRRAMLQYPYPLAIIVIVVAHICCHSLKLTS